MTSTDSDEKRDVPPKAFMLPVMSLSLGPIDGVFFPRSSVKPRVMSSQSSVKFLKTHLKTAQNSAKRYKKAVHESRFLH